MAVNNSGEPSATELRLGTIKRATTMATQIGSWRMRRIMSPQRNPSQEGPDGSDYRQLRHHRKSFLADWA
jgi:hypothetical protein